MKYIKKYEDTTREPQIGDYVICKEEVDLGSVVEFDTFIENNIGKIISDNPEKYNYDKKYKYIVEYDTDKDFSVFDRNPYTGKRNIRGMSRKEILYFSPNLEHIKSILSIYKDANKYNL